MGEGTSLVKQNPLTFLDFLWLGREQWLTYSHPLARLFTRWLGPLGVHTRIRNAQVLRVIKGLSLPYRARVLDAGCGHAYASFWLARYHPDWEIWGIDINSEVIGGNQRTASALGLRNLHFLEGDITNLDVSAPFDLVFSIDVLEHLADDVGALLNWRQAMSRAGWLVLHLPLRHQMQRRVFPAFRHHIVSNHLRDEYTEEEIRTELVQAGFVVCSVAYGFGFCGELAFELNYLFWQHSRLRTILALLTFPLSVSLGYVDSRSSINWGNSLILVARPSD